MIEEIRTINPYFFKVFGFSNDTIKQKQEEGITLEYKEKDLFILDKTLFYSLLRLTNLPIGEYRKFSNDDKNRLLNVYFKMLSTSLEWELTIEKQNRTFRTKHGLGLECAIYSVFSMRKVPPKKVVKAKIKNVKTQQYYNSKQEEFLKEKPLEASILIVVIAVVIYWFLKTLGGN